MVRPPDSLFNNLPGLTRRHTILQTGLQPRLVARGISDQDKVFIIVGRVELIELICF